MPGQASQGDDASHRRPPGPGRPAVVWSPRPCQPGPPAGRGRGCLRPRGRADHGHCRCANLTATNSLLRYSDSYPLDAEPQAVHREAPTCQVVNMAVIKRRASYYLIPASPARDVLVRVLCHQCQDFRPQAPRFRMSWDCRRCWSFPAPAGPSDDQDRTGGMMHAVLADRAEHRPGESAMSPAAHHQHVRPAGGPHQHLGGMPLHDG